MDSFKGLTLTGQEWPESIHDDAEIAQSRAISSGVAVPGVVVWGDAFKGGELTVFGPNGLAWVDRQDDDVITVITYSFPVSSPADVGDVVERKDSLNENWRDYPDGFERIPDGVSDLVEAIEALIEGEGEGEGWSPKDPAVFAALAAVNRAPITAVAIALEFVGRF
tara:strand:- start:165 stop:662 length:498 start_codon:yes stop_codon:yes gene_type:complete